MRAPVFFLALAFANLVHGQYSWVGTYAGNGQNGLVNGPLASSQFNTPYGIAVDDNTQTMFVADAFNNCIRKIQYGVVSTLAGSGTSGDVDGQGAYARLSLPSGVFLHDGYLYFSDNNNHKIKRVDQQGNVITIAGNGSVGTANGPANTASFYNPVGVIVRSDGVIFVADYLNHAIRKIENGYVSTFAGMPGVSGDQLGQGTAARFDRPTGMAIDAQDNIYVADQMNQKVKIISTSGNVTLFAGNGVEATVDGVGAGASFKRPTYVAWDPTGGLMVAEWMGNVIRRITPDGTVTTIAGTGDIGYVDSWVGDAQFHSPYGIAVDQYGNAYIGDKENHVVRYLAKYQQSLLGVPDILSATAGVTLFPNPSTGIVNLSWPGHLGLIRVEVFDARGAQTEVPMERGSDGLRLNVAALPAGIYEVRATSNGAVSLARLMRN